MKKINPLYFRHDEGWPLHVFLRIGKRVGAVIGIALLFAGRFYFNTFPFKIIAYFIGTIFAACGLRGDALIGFWFVILLFLIAVYVLYHALLGMFAGFLANALFCLYKKVKVKINEEDNSIDYLDFSKKITKADVRRFFIHGVLLTVLIIAISSYFLWDWNILLGL
ncbi:MAG: hypothetical protein J5672_01330 [Verrucomicrobia bacterium]|nr:hypothetical protein [Verrucomicrobiota bacterium]